MKHRYLAYLVLLVAVTSLLTACGGGDGGGPVPSVAFTATYPDYFTTMPETFALANDTDTVLITANVKNADGTTAADGTPVRFTLPAGATFANTSSATTRTTVGGTTAPVFVKHTAVIAPAKNAIVPVSASALGVGSSINVKFINQPSSVDVSVALTPSLVGVEGVQLDISDVDRIHGNASIIAGPPAPTTVNLATGGNWSAAFDATNQLSHVGFIAFPGVNTTAAVPIVKITYSVVLGIDGVADFNPSPPTITGFIVAGVGGATLIPPGPTNQNFVVTFKYDTE